ncbi:MAG: hypothetical protein JWP09_778 [Candidatus Taylorbacteria bacterium]|nr:hypothetical protein [Candidatus Taylorbacteria bacterium]
MSHPLPGNPIIGLTLDQARQFIAQGKILAQFPEFKPCKDSLKHITQGFLRRPSHDAVYATEFMRTLPDGEVRVCEVGFLNLGDSFTLWKFRPGDDKLKIESELSFEIVLRGAHAGALTGEFFVIQLTGDFHVAYTFTNWGQIIVGI